MKGVQIVLTETSYHLLLDYFDTADLTAFNRHRLLHGLKNARVVNEECLPLNIVSYDTKVVVWNTDKNQTFTVRLVLPGKTNGKGKLSMYDPIAVALTGYPAGATTQWEMPDGINTFKIVSVNQLNTGRVYA